jgi:hypothetical protein
MWECKWKEELIPKETWKTKEKKSAFSARDIQKPFRELKNRNFILLTKYCIHHTEIRDIVIGHGLMLLLSIAKWHDLLNSQSPVYDGDRQAPPDLSNLLLEGSDPDPDKWLTCHKSILAFPRRNASASSNRRSFGSKRYFQRNL